jgi:hypothetical protein
MARSRNAPFAGSAIFDATGRYRYLLRRRWERSGPRAAFILLNPSTADATNDDPTIRRCAGFAQSWGFASMEIVNIFAFRATDPGALRAAVDPVGPENDRHVLMSCRRAHLRIAGWGNHGRLHARSEAVLTLLRKAGGAVCLGVTKQGQPRHPLYLRKDARTSAYDIP